MLAKANYFFENHLKEKGGSVYTTKTSRNQITPEVKMHQLPPGTLFHCIPECFKGYYHKWASEAPGVPRRCSHCKTPYHDKFPRSVTRQMVLDHLCSDCLKAWNELKPKESIEKEDIIRLDSEPHTQMWNRAYEKMQITEKNSLKQTQG